MKANYTHISILLDKSSSMFKIRYYIIAGFNKFLKEQKEFKEGELTVSMAEFSDPDKYRLIYDFAPVEEISDLTEQTYYPHGYTAYNDALAEMTDYTGKQLAAMDENQRPDKVLVVTFSDGEENESVKYPLGENNEPNEEIRRIIEHQEQVYNWKYMYIGANQDSKKEASTRSMSASMNFMANEKGVSDMFYGMSNVVKRYRKTGNLSIEE